LACPRRAALIARKRRARRRKAPRLVGALRPLPAETPPPALPRPQIIAQAGLPGSVTIATNMAGRGTDIILGGNPEGLAQLALLRLVYRRLAPVAHGAPPGAAPGHEEDDVAAAAAAGALGVPRIPLGVFDLYDAGAAGAERGAKESGPHLLTAAGL
jgi:hypothetical protein